ncbi:MAG: hypothetical protein LBL97_02785 [Prevotellaceae bacterium]|jgi:hypothetical protein|nr:hypothetical protein [Prevotellaceae bacterium]
MRNLHHLYICLLAGLLLAACSAETPEMSLPDAPHPATGVEVWLSPTRAAGDADNLPEEYSLLNVSFFLTDAGGSTFTDKFIHQPTAPAVSTGADCLGCRKVTLPAELATATRKDIYVVANFDDAERLASLATVADLQALATPKRLVNSNLNIDRGLPMYGMSADVDLSSNALRVMLQRICAKLRVTLTFTDPSWVGSRNRIEMHDVAPYTYFMPRTGFGVPANELINYSQVTLTQISEQTFRGVIYLYESNTLPYLQLYTVVDGKEKIYTAKDHFPLPVRNRLYDVEIEMLPPTQTRSAEGAVTFSYNFTTYGE